MVQIQAQALSGQADPGGKAEKGPLLPAQDMVITLDRVELPELPRRRQRWLPRSKKSSAATNPVAIRSNQLTPNKGSGLKAKAKSTPARTPEP